MPVPTPIHPLTPDSLLQFTGVNLRRDGLSMEDGDVVRAINMDFHPQLGTARRRRGRTALFPQTLGAPVRLLQRHAGRRYAVAGTTLSRSEALLLTGLAAQQLTTLLAVRPLLDTRTWVFIADQALMRKDNGTTVQAWGIVAPSAAPSLSAGPTPGLTGSYRARYTYARLVAGKLATESNLSPQPAAVPLTNQGLQVAVEASSDPQVTHIVVYRTLAGGSLSLFDQQVPNTTQTVTLTQPDSALGTPGPADGANTPPPLLSWITEFQGHVFGCQDPANPNYLWIAERFQPEYWPPGQFLRIGLADDPLQCAVPLTGFLGVFSRRSKWRVSGNAVAGFTHQEALNTRGTPAPQAVLATSRGVGFVARDGLYVTNFVQADQELAPVLLPLFEDLTVHDYAPIDWSRVAEVSLAEYKQRLYFGYVDTQGTRMVAVCSLHTGKWYFYQGHPVRSLWWDETDDQLWLGGADGRGWVLETGPDDGGQPLQATLVSQERPGGDRFVRKLWRYLKVDADVPLGETAELDFVLDGVVRHTVKVSGPRVKRLLRLPDDLLGWTWHVVWRASGPGPCALYAVRALDTPLEEAGHA